MNKYCIWILAC